jgi:predicted transcriptional regulator
MPSVTEERRGIAEGKRDIMHRMDTALIEWLDAEASKFDRTRSYLVEHAVRMWKRRLERERRARKGKRR